MEYQRHNYLTEYSNVPAGQRILIIAEAEDGPLHEPTMVYTEKMAKAIFKNGPLIDRTRELLTQMGATTTYVMRIEAEEFMHALDIIKGLDFDLLFIDGLDFSERYKEEIAFYLNMAHEKANLGRLIHTFMKVDEVDDLNELHNEFMMIEEMRHQMGFEQFEFGKYLSVVADQISGAHSALVYMATVAELTIGESPVNKPIKYPLKKVFSKDEIRILRDNGLVSFRDSFHYKTVCAASPCAVTTPKSPHRNITNFRIVQITINEIVEGLNTLVGGNINSRSIDKAERYIAQNLELKIIDGILQDYTYEITVDGLKHTMYIKIEMVPVFTVEKVVTHAQIKLLK